MTLDLIQGSREWKLARAGKVTASRVGDATARSKKNGDWLASRANYMAELVIERLTGEPVEQYVSEPMRWGTEHEPDARDLYAFLTDAPVTVVGFCPHPTITMAGGSPDGYVGDDGCIQIKCPNTSTHIETLLGASIDLSYRKQMQFEMACSGRQWCDFISYDPRLPPEFRIFIKRFPRNDKMIWELEQDVVRFLKELDEQIAALTERRNKMRDTIIIVEDAA